MKNVSKIWKTAIASCLVLCLCLSFAACGGGDDTTAPTEPSTAGKATYTVRVATLGGIPLKNVSVYVYADAAMEELETMKPLGADGTITFEATAKETYYAVLMGIPKGYNVQESYVIDKTNVEIVLTPSVITDEEKPADKVYALGDVMYDFTVTDAEGVTHKLSEMLQEKEAVVLNFWYLNCSPCKLEFPYLEMAYAEFSEQIEVLAINCEDGNDAEISAFKEDYGLTFPVAIGNKDYWYPAAYSACPTTIVIDRYGVIVYMHAGYFDEVAPFVAMFRSVTGEDYQQTLIQDIESVIIDSDYRPDGSEERPFEVGSTLAFDVKVPANGTVYYNLYRLDNVTMRIENPNAYVIVDGQTHRPVNGVIEMKLTCEDTFTPVNVAFCNSSSSRNTIHVEFVFEPGNINNPLELVLGDNIVEVDQLNVLGKYFTYTATTSGVLTLTVQECTEGVTPDMSMYNLNTYEAVYECTLDPETGLYTICVAVNEGDQVQIIIGAATAPESGITSATIKALASIQGGGGSGVIDGKEGYSVTVVDQDGNPVSNVTLQLFIGSNPTTLKTDETGVASIRLTANAYQLKLQVPVGYVARETAYLLTPGLPALTIQLTATTTYSVQIQRYDGLPVAGTMVKIYADAALEEMLYVISTDENGVLSFTGMVNTVYYIVLGNVDEDVLAEEFYDISSTEAVITLATSAPTYGLGDVLPEFIVTATDGTEYSLQQILQEKQALILVFWDNAFADGSTYLSDLQKAYEIYGDKAMILALNPVETQADTLDTYREKYNLTYPVAGSTAGMAKALCVTTFPTTVVIDRTGTICLVHAGQITDAASLDTLFRVFTADDYVTAPFASLEELLQFAAAPDAGGDQGGGNDGEGDQEEDPDTGDTPDPEDGTV